MDLVNLKLSPRALRGKRVKKLRRNGIVPVHVYGRDMAPEGLQVETQVLRRILPRVGTNIPLSVEIEGEAGDHICFVREVQRHPVTEDILHVDFMKVSVTEVVRAAVPVVLLGAAPAVRNLGGTLLQSLQTVLVESLPMNVPPSFQVDVSELDSFEMSVNVRDISVDPNVTVLTLPDALIARVIPPRVEEEVVAEAAAPEAEEEGVAEGEEQPSEGAI